ncbi:DEKNAAC102805 [Brettanomyces naardenensis]|uniref:DEKNAAC102805 n=1 Tax=Brettanomyces naardenensis TaxID=13370 RepID=A0A448YL17_BRENA|nr:DEKNAAC102805 [Brettanomyces naardenensis]
MGTFNDFIDSQKIIYELKSSDEEGQGSEKEESTDQYPYDKKELYYQEGIPSRHSQVPFIRLLEGKEPISNMERRYQLYKKNWSRQLSIINGILENTDREMFQELQNFLCTNGSSISHSFLNYEDRSNWRVPCALLNLGSNISNHGRLLNQIYDFLDKDEDTIVVRLNTAVCSTIKSCMKMISYEVVTSLKAEGDERVEDDDDTEERDIGAPLSFTSKAYRKLPDLEEVVGRLHNRGMKLLLLVEDADSLPTGTLSQLLKTVWHSSLRTQNIHLVIGISTPLIIFQEKIPRLVLNILRTKNFHIDNSTEAIGQIMGNLLLNINDTYNSLIFEPRLVLHFLKLKSGIGISQFYDYMKIIYMNHYFSQPLSILWTDDFSGIQLTDEYFGTFKRLPSLRKMNEDHQETDAGPETSAFYKSLLQNNNEAAIGSFLRLNLNKLINWRFNLRSLIDFLNFMQSYFYDLKLWKNNLELFQLIFEHYDYDNVYNNVANFDFLKPIFLNMRNMEVSVFNKFLDIIQDDEQFEFLFQEAASNDTNSYFQNLKHANSHKDVDKFITHLNEKLTSKLVELNLDNQPFKEICCVGMDITELLKSSFNPSVRDIEMDALLSSKSYLLNAVHTDLTKLEPTGLEMQLYKIIEPSMIEIFRLYREAGVVINIYDFYQVFCNALTDRKRVCRLMLKQLSRSQRRTKEDKMNMNSLHKILDELEDKGEDAECEEWDKLTLSWFLKGLVELELIGLIKEGKSNSESIEKLIWKGI